MLGPLLDVSPACPEAHEVRGADLGEVVEEIGVVELDAGRSGRVGGARPADRAGARKGDAICSSVVVLHLPPPGPGTSVADRSEERRVGKEGRSRWSPYH